MAIDAQMVDPHMHKKEGVLDFELDKDKKKAEVSKRIRTSRSIFPLSMARRYGKHPATSTAANTACSLGKLR